MVAAIKAVKQPITARMVNSPPVNMGYTLPNKNTPAATMVAAWMRAETEVGPSMASGSQVCKGNCADLAATAKNMPPQATYCHPPGNSKTVDLTKAFAPNSCSISKV